MNAGAIGRGGSRLLALAFLFAPVTVADAEPCREVKKLSWAEKQVDLGGEVGDATCAQAKVYGCEAEIEAMISARFGGESCRVVVHTSLGPITCCLFRAQDCKQMRACFGGAK